MFQGTKKIQISASLLNSKMGFLWVQIPAVIFSDPETLDYFLRKQVMDSLIFRIGRESDPDTFRSSLSARYLEFGERYIVQISLNGCVIGKLKIISSMYYESDAHFRKYIEEQVRSRLVLQVVTPIIDHDPLPIDTSTVFRMKLAAEEIDQIMATKIKRNTAPQAQDVSEYPEMGGLDVAVRRGTAAHEVFEDAEEVDL